MFRRSVISQSLIIVEKEDGRHLLVTTVCEPLIPAFVFSLRAAHSLQCPLTSMGGKMPSNPAALLTDQTRRLTYSEDCIAPGYLKGAQHLMK